MYSMDLNSNETTTNCSSTTFYCGYAPNISWEIRGPASFYMIIGLTTVMVSFPTIILNALIILAIKQRKELQKPSNILLSSMAVTDLLVGAITIPTSATIDFFMLGQVSLELTCMLYSAFTLPCYFTSPDYHCLGEVRGGTKMDGLQAYYHKWPPQKDCDRYLALGDLPSDCKLYNESVCCGS